MTLATACFRSGSRFRVGMTTDISGTVLVAAGLADMLKAVSARLLERIRVSCYR
jgi:hypothetical protein